MTARVLPQTGVGSLALAAGGLLAAAHLLGAQGARIGPVDMPAWSASWLLLPSAVAMVLGRPGHTRSSLGRVAVAALL